MKTIRIEVTPIHQDQSFQIEGIRKIKYAHLYKIRSEKKISTQVVEEVFGDSILNRLGDQSIACDYVVEVSFKAGVTDNSALSAREGLKLLDVNAEVASGMLYFLETDLGKAEILEVIAERLANPLIQKIELFDSKSFSDLDRFNKVSFPEMKMEHAPQTTTIDLDVPDRELEELSRARCLALTLSEMKYIQGYYKKLSRKPTDVELEVLAQTWSEHCKHKIFASKIDFDGLVVNSLYKTYIKDTTKKIKESRNLDWLISVFSDNAGVVRFDKNIDQCIKVETHNSPSALDPFGGAITGILGVNRDILGVGMGGFPIANTDVFCFGEKNQEGLPSELKDPSAILEGVHQGVEDGGNKSGIPTVNGAFYFDKSFAGKPLVFVGTVGVVPQKLSDGSAGSHKNPQVGDRIVMIGGAIGCDGIHGATFSSLELNEDSPVSAVQIGDPLMQKRVTDFLRVAQERLLYTAITDNGAGGLSSSVGEMATFTGGAEVHLDRCPVKYPGLSPYELFISESQERMTLSVSDEKWEQFEELAESIGVEASSIGRFNDSGKLNIYYNQKMVAELDLHFMHDSLPQMELKATWTPPQIEVSGETPKIDFNKTLLDLLKRPNIASKEPLVRRYDHEVQAATCVKPFNHKNGPNDSGVIWLYPHGGEVDSGVSIGCGLNPRMSQYEPELMAKMAVDEAIRNVVVSGGDLDHCCLVDNFCWPDPVKSANNPDGDYKLGQLVKTCQGLASISTAYGTPMVSGKDSMKNDYRGEVIISVLPTLLITAMAKVNVKNLVTSDFKKAGDHIYIIGKEAKGLLGSEFAEIVEGEYQLPHFDSELNAKSYREYYRAVQGGLIESAHDVSDGGLAVTLCESMMGSGLGVSIRDRHTEESLFSESAGRIMVTIDPEKVTSFEGLVSNYTFLGKVTSSNKLLIDEKIDLSLNQIEQAWKESFNADA